LQTAILLRCQQARCPQRSQQCVNRTDHIGKIRICTEIRNSSCRRDNAGRAGGTNGTCCTGRTYGAGGTNRADRTGGTCRTGCTRSTGRTDGAGRADGAGRTGCTHSTGRTDGTNRAGGTNRADRTGGTCCTGCTRCAGQTCRTGRTHKALHPLRAGRPNWTGNTLDSLGSLIASRAGNALRAGRTGGTDGLIAGIGILTAGILWTASGGWILAAAIIFPSGIGAVGCIALIAHTRLLFNKNQHCKGGFASLFIL